MPPAATHSGQTIRQAAKGRAAASRDVVKPVLASPFSVPWPSLPTHLQNGVMAALPQILPAELADYHVSRARCSQAAKRARRRLKRAAEQKESDMDVDGAKAETKASASGAAADDDAIPPRPEILDHLVLGLNETIRELERGIDDLRIRMACLAEAVEKGNPRYLPTQPAPALGAGQSGEEAPVALLLVPHTSVSPLALVDPLPTYCATYNTLLRQAGDMARSTRLPGGVSAVSAFTMPPIRIVPLGDREADIAAAAGLRRITSVGVRSSHPALPVLERLLPNSVLQPPRHSMTLPWPTMKLKVHAGESKPGANGAKADASKAKSGEEGTGAAQTQETQHPTRVDFAPLHVKALHTTAPLDAAARRAQRLAEVRQRRVEAKARRQKLRAEMERKLDRALVGAPAPRTRGRASRRAAKGLDNKRLPAKLDTQPQPTT